MKDNSKEKQKAWYEANKERVLANQKIYREKNKEKLKQYQKEWREAHPDYNKKYIEEHKPHIQDLRKNRYERNRDEELAYQAEFRSKDPDYIKRYNRKRRKEDPLFKLSGNLRVRINAAFKANHWQKGKGSEVLLGCTFEEAKSYITKQFTKEMSWSNYGEVWEIDHRIPLSSAKTEEEMRELCKCTNLQPLTVKENREKGDRQ